MGIRMKLAEQMKQNSKSDVYKNQFTKDIVLNLIKVYSEYHLYELEYSFRPNTSSEEKQALVEFLFNEGFRVELLFSEYALFVSWR